MADTKSFSGHHSFHIPQAGLVGCFDLAICLPVAEHSCPFVKGPPKLWKLLVVFCIYLKWPLKSRNMCVGVDRRKEWDSGRQSSGKHLNDFLCNSWAGKGCAHASGSLLTNRLQMRASFKTQNKTWYEV